MTAIRQDITIEQGADYDTPFLLKDDDGSPDDLTGSAFIMQIRTSFDAPNSLLTLSTADSSLVLDATNGIVRPAIGYAVTAGFYSGSYVYDLKQRTAGGKVRRRRQGAVTITQQVTMAMPPTPLAPTYTDAQGNAYSDAEGNPYTAAGVSPPPPSATYTDAGGSTYTTASNEPYTP